MFYSGFIQKEKGAKKTSKKRQKQLNLSAAIFADSESDSELPDYGNGLDTTLTENDDNVSNDGGDYNKKSLSKNQPN